jgi:hypothetical protein
MVFSVRRFIKEAQIMHKDDQEDFKRIQWIMDDWPAQAISIVSQIVWCGITETILKSETDEDSIEVLDWWLGENVKQIGEIT